MESTEKGGEAITPEDYASMEEVVSHWSLVKENETKKDLLFRRRKYLFTGWIISVGLSSAAIEYPAAFLATALNITIAQAATAVFFVMLAYSIYYGWQIYDLDDKLSQFSGAISKSQSEDLVATTEGATLDQEIAETLSKNGIRFGKGVVRGSERGELMAIDFAIPSTRKPSVFIGTQVSVSITAAYALAQKSRIFKTVYPKAMLDLSNKNAYE